MTGKPLREGNVPSQNAGRGRCGGRQPETAGPGVAGGVAALEGGRRRQGQNEYLRNAKGLPWLSTQAALLAKRGRRGPGGVRQGL